MRNRNLFFAFSLICLTGILASGCTIRIGGGEEAKPIETKAKNWKFDLAHSHIGFGITHMGVATTRGRFDIFSGTFTEDANKPGDMNQWKVNVEIDAASINTANEGRDKHLRNKDFFDVETHKTITFVSKKFGKSGDTVTITGDFTMHGVTKEVSVVGKFSDIKQTSGKDGKTWTGKGFSGTAVIDRMDFGVGSSRVMDGGFKALDEKVYVQIDIELHPEE